jgi:hypothetical protein
MYIVVPEGLAGSLLQLINDARPQITPARAMVLIFHCVLIVCSLSNDPATNARKIAGGLPVHDSRRE